MELQEVFGILGGMKVLRMKIENKIDLIALSKRGVPKNALLQLTHYFRFSQGQMAELLPVSGRTLQRYAPKKLLSPIVSEHILRLAEVAAKGRIVFEDKNKFLVWLNQPNITFSNKSPLSILDSSFGTDMVLDELGRIEHGVYS